jgi:hypothetical protein
VSAESIILTVAESLLLLTTASRFLVQELISLVVLCKKLKATIKNGLPSEQPQLLDQRPSKRELG